MPSLSHFVTALAQSPILGLVLRTDTTTTDVVIDELAQQNIAYQMIALESTTSEEYFLQKFSEAEQTGEWIILECLSPEIPTWLSHRLRRIQKEQRAGIEARVLVVMSWQDMEASSDDTLLSCFSLLYRPEEGE